jgi:hypothetical protein
VALKPLLAFVLSDGLEAPAHRILADDLLHAQQLGQHAIAAQRRDMGITFVAGQNREHRCAKHVALLRRVRARIGERAIGHSRVEQVRHLEVFDEERELPIGRQRRRWVPFNPYWPRPSVERCRCQSVLFNYRLITRWVSGKEGRIAGHVLENARFSSKASSVNCRT